MAKQKVSDEEAVWQYMAQMDHPLKAEIGAVRAILRGSYPELKERIKWAAPSYHLHGQDLVTFNHRHPSKVHLVFHHLAIVLVASPLLEGDYKDRRMAYFDSMADVQAKEGELRRIMQEYAAGIR